MRTCSCARQGGSQITHSDDLVPKTAHDAYAVNRAVAERLGWEPLGWKIAGTTDAMRGKLQLDGPIYGRTFRRFACISQIRFKATELLDPLIECEFFVTLARDLPPRAEPWTPSETLEAIAEVHARHRSGGVPLSEKGPAAAARHPCRRQRVGPLRHWRPDREMA